MSLINKTAVKETTEFSISEEVYGELDKKLDEMIKKAEERARGNGRRTIFKRDL